MALLGTLIDTRTVALAATASTGFAHSLGAAPDMVWGAASFATGSLSTNFPYFCASADSASVSVQNRGTTAETFSVYSMRAHSVIR